jgi:transcriptional regulator with XRE-family HTH domain
VTTTLPARRAELAQFLRNRRARLTPADVGLPPGLRRRTPGLRREEVAQLAGVGVTWYTWLEQGRPINVSVQILDAVARTLRLDQAEREHLYRLAEVPAVPDAGASDRVAPEVQTILDNLVPLPASVYNGRYDLLAWNRTYAALFPGLVSAPPGERNALWQMFIVPGCCAAIANKDAELPAMVATFRAAFGRHLGEPAWTQLVQSLSEASPEFARMWAEHDVAGPSTRIKIFQHIDGHVLATTSTSLAISATPESRIQVYTPADAAGYQLLQEITARPPRITKCPRHRDPGHVTIS